MAHVVKRLNWAFLIKSPQLTRTCLRIQIYNYTTIMITRQL